jgi:hypothetical protein
LLTTDHVVDRERGGVTRRDFLRWAGAAAAGLVLAPNPGQGRRPAAGLRLIGRAAWGAAGPNLEAPAERGQFDAATNPGGWLVYPPPLADWLTTLVVHHSALPLSDGPREIQRLHQQERGFADIGYHYVIGPAGEVYAGRSLEVRGVHTGGANTGTVGVVLLGNFELDAPPEPQLASLRRLAHSLARRHGLTHLAGHHDFQPDATVCPGQFLAPLLPGLAAGLGLAFGTGGYVPPPWTTVT